MKNGKGITTGEKSVKAIWSEVDAATDARPFLVSKPEQKKVPILLAGQPNLDDEDAGIQNSLSEESSNHLHWDCQTHCVRISSNHGVSKWHSSANG